MKLLKKVVSVATAFCVTAALTLTVFASPANPQYTQSDGYFYQMNADDDLNAAPAHAQEASFGSRNALLLIRAGFIHTGIHASESRYCTFVSETGHIANPSHKLWTK